MRGLMYKTVVYLLIGMNVLIGFSILRHVALG
jgi:hypothetical protein